MQYDSTKNKLSVNQDQTAKAIMEFIVALQAAKESGGEITTAEIFQVAVAHVPEAARQIVGLLSDNVPNGEDAYKVAFGVVNQFDFFK